jgi:hypothetical protein
MQDRLPPDRRKPLATRGRTIHEGQSRHSDRGLAASGLPRTTDIIRASPHVSNVPAAAIRWPRPSVSLTRHACLSAWQNSPPGGDDISLVSNACKPWKARASSREKRERLNLRRIDHANPGSMKESGGRWKIYALRGRQLAGAAPSRQAPPSS